VGISPASPISHGASNRFGAGFIRKRPLFDLFISNYSCLCEGRDKAPHTWSRRMWYLTGAAPAMQCQRCGLTPRAWRPRITSTRCEQCQRASTNIAEFPPARGASRHRMKSRPYLRIPVRCDWRASEPSEFDKSLLKIAHGGIVHTAKSGSMRSWARRHMLPNPEHTQRRECTYGVGVAAD